MKQLKQEKSVSPQYVLTTIATTTAAAVAATAYEPHLWFHSCTSVNGCYFLGGIEPKVSQLYNLYILSAKCILLLLKLHANSGL